MRRIDYIVVHASATPPDMQVNAAVIDSWHKAKGWDGIGYHFVVNRNGDVEIGRPVDKAGAHVYGYNAYSIGICMIGGVNSSNEPENNYTPAQWYTMKQLFLVLHAVYPGAQWLGHRDFPNVHKDCPCFDVKEWLDELRAGR